MNQSPHITRQTSALLLTGLGVLGLVFFTPDAAQHHSGSLFRMAASSSWHRLLELSAAWCSLKIILASIGLFLVIESLGSVLVWWKLQDLAKAVFSLELLSVLIFLVGNYYLVKALF